jgi:hypothetical protein
MTARRRGILNVLATGFLVLLVTVLVLFWARWGCETARHGLLAGDAWWLDIDASRLLMPRTAEEPNGIPCRVRTQMTSGAIDSEALGAARSQKRLRLDNLDSLWSVWCPPDQDQALYDRSLGLMMYQFLASVLQPDGTYTTERPMVAYAGPAGIADTPDREIGRFNDPIVRVIGGNLGRPVVYDRAARRFFMIDWRGKTVKQGPALVDKGLTPVVDFGWPRKESQCLNLYLDTPEPHYTYSMDRDRTLALDAAGNIWMLNLDTLEYVAPAGRLPAPDTLFPPTRRTKPDDLFALSILPVFLGRDYTYAGCAVAVLSRDATSMKLEVFNAEGTSVAMQQSNLKDPYEVARSGGHHAPVSTVAALYFDLPGAAVLTATKFILESLHPPVLLWPSYFTASSIEAVAGHRAMFVLPNSFAAMKARDVGAGWLARFVGALPFLLPGVLLGVVLAVAIGRNARRLGLPAGARRLWIVATVLFGLPAYVTYRITRPATARVTCANCGRDRWVDREKCHHCGSPWLVPELIPPAWRVIGQPEEQPGNDPSPRPEETISNT